MLIKNVALYIYACTFQLTASGTYVVGATLTALNLMFTVLVTLFIVGRIIVVRRRHTCLMGKWVSEGLLIRSHIDKVTGRN
jgi:hypothetical protein